MRRIAPLLLAALLTGCHHDTPSVDAGPQPFDAGTLDGGCGWPQWGQNPQHTGAACAPGQAFGRTLATFTFDPLVPQEQAESPGGDLTAHYQSPLILGDDVYMLLKSGSWIACEPPGSGQLSDGGLCGADAWQSQQWNEVHFRWESGALTQKATLPSDWKPPPDIFSGSFEPVFAPALNARVLYLPGAGGTVHVIDRGSDRELRRIDPFEAAGSPPNPDRFVAGPLTVDDQGRVLYTVLQIGDPDPYQGALGYVVRSDADGHSQAVRLQEVVRGAPAETDSCVLGFNPALTPQPWPPVDDAGNPVPTRMTACGQQRPAINAAPAVATDGTIYLVTRAHRSARTAFVVALNPDLSAKWATSLTGHLGDGCGVTVPADVDGTGALPDGGVHLSHCRIGATLGVDPSTNLPPAGMADDSSSSSPVVLPDGSVLYGALTLYNDSRGHLMKFSPTGAYQAAYDFGWDETPAVFAHDGTYSILGKDNHYFTYNEDQDGPYFMTRLGPDLSPEWKLQSTNTENCARGDDGGTVCSTETCVPDGDGGTICTPDHPNGFEWCVNAPAIDPSGTAFVNSEDGRLYAINPDGGEREHLFLLESLGAAYTPIALDAQGRIYTLNGGVMTVVGQ